MGRAPRLHRAERPQRRGVDSAAEVTLEGRGRKRRAGSWNPGLRGQSRAEATGVPTLARRHLAPAPRRPRAGEEEGCGGKREGKQEEVQQGQGLNATSARGSSPTDCRPAAGSLGPARRPPGLPSLGHCPTALTLPHDALQPPFHPCRRHLPNTAEDQPLPTTRNLLRPWGSSSGEPAPSHGSRPPETSHASARDSGPPPDGGCAVQVDSQWAAARPLVGGCVHWSSMSRDVKSRNLALRCELTGCKKFLVRAYSTWRREGSCA